MSIHDTLMRKTADVNNIYREGESDTIDDLTNVNVKIIDKMIVMSEDKNVTLDDLSKISDNIIKVKKSMNDVAIIKQRKNVDDENSSNRQELLSIIMDIKYDDTTTDDKDLVLPSSMNLKDEDIIPGSMDTNTSYIDSSKYLRD